MPKKNPLQPLAAIGEAVEAIQDIVREPSVEKLGDLDESLLEERDLLFMDNLFTQATMDPEVLKRVAIMRHKLNNSIRLTKDEVEAGYVQYNEERPFFIARSPDDGYCPHMDRETYACKVYENRPLRCRRYDCRDDSEVWPDGVPDN